jgi:hypothetical protein
VTTLFRDDGHEDVDLYSHQVTSKDYHRVEMGRQRLAFGRAAIRSKVTGEASPLHYVVLHLGEQNILGRVRRDMNPEEFARVRKETEEAFRRGNIAEVLSLTEANFGRNAYSLEHLFRDEQYRIMQLVVSEMLIEVEQTFRQTYKRYYPIMQASSDMHIPVPRILSSTQSFLLNTDLRDILGQPDIDLEQLRQLVADVKLWKIDVDADMLSLEASARCNELMAKLEADPEAVETMETLNELLEILTDLHLQLNVWQTQNSYFRMGQGIYQDKQKQAEAGDTQARRWTEAFERLGEQLQVKVV